MGRYKLNRRLGQGGSNDLMTLTLDDVVSVIRTMIRINQGERSEEHTSELQSLVNLVCRLLLEKKKYFTPVT